jgi:hypothetical protein
MTEPIKKEPHCAGRNPNQPGIPDSHKPSAQRTVAVPSGGDQQTKVTGASPNGESNPPKK